MAYKYTTSLLANLFIFNILLAMTGQAFAGRHIPTNNKNVDKKQPEWFIGSGDGSFLIPGIGRVYVPKLDGNGKGNPVGGSSGGDDAIVPIPGVEVPNPPPPGGSNLAPYCP